MPNIYLKILLTYIQVKAFSNIFPKTKTGTPLPSPLSSYKAAYTGKKNRTYRKHDDSVEGMWVEGTGPGSGAGDGDSGSDLEVTAVTSARYLTTCIFLCK